MNLNQRIYNHMPLHIQNIICTLAGVRVLWQRYGKEFKKALRWLEGSDHWSYQRLRDYQTERLKYMVNHCYDTVPYYHRLFRELKIRPDAVKTIDDLKRLPVLTKQKVRENPDMFISSKFKKSSLVKVSTSGTTGAGMFFYRQPETLCIQTALWWRFRKRFGLKVRDRYANFSGQKIVPLAQKHPPFWRHNRAMNQTYFSIFHLSEKTFGDYFEYLNKQEYVYYCGYPSAISFLAEFIVSHNLKLDKPPKVITTGSETLLPSQCRLIARAFECPVVDFYGSAEQVCSMARCECGLYHEDMELGIIERQEIERHEGGIAAKIIATGLIEEGMPLLRYDTGDIATFVNSSCRCRRESLVAKEIDGRMESYIVTPDGRRVGRMAHVFAELKNIYESQVEQNTPDTLRVKVVKKPGYSQADQIFYEKKIHEIVGNDMKIEFEYMSFIPREKNGKFRAVISRI